jgi:iron uptake system component EfeO
MVRFPVRIASIVVAVGALALLVTSCGSSGDSQTGTEPVTGADALYRSYLEQTAEDLVGWSERMVDRIRSENFGNAESPYASARASYGQIEPVAEGFKSLDHQLDASFGEAPPSKLGGFHGIEWALWNEKHRAGLVQVANRYLADVKKLQLKVRTADLDPLRITNEANKTLADASDSALRGKEDPYSHIDLVDISANVEGAQAVFETVKPLVAEKDPDLVRETEDAFDGAYDGLRHFGYPARDNDAPRPSAPGVAFVQYIERTKDEFRQLGERLDALRKPLSEVPAVISGE